MSRWLHRFNTVAEYTTARNDNYLEPWVSYTEENTKVNYNMTEEEKLGTPLTFEIQSNGDIRWKAINTAYTVTLEYSKNGGDWTSVTSATDTSAPSISVASGDTVQFRAPEGVIYTSMSSGISRYNCFSGTTCNFAVKGNIMSLLDSTNFSAMTALQSAYTFNYLFYNCTGLTDTNELLLLATTLANNCYSNMFVNCTSLTTAPALPATTLAQACYAGMFQGCTGLSQVPELPATTLAQRCYQYMFQRCTSLTTAPELPATTLVDSCYRGMFYDCLSLTTAPELPATTLANSCYNVMFNGCSGLTTAPALLATTLALNCYQSMFSDCTSLTTAPELPATTLAQYCYRSMFEGCTSLTSAPELPATTLVNSCYLGMFQRCGSLNYIKCFATDISASNCTIDWLKNVSPTGTFVTPSTTAWSTDTSGIPTGWTRVNA